MRRSVRGGLAVAKPNGMVAHEARGFSLVEAVIAVSVLAVGVSAVAQVVLASARANVASQQAAVVQQAARERMEQLRALAWTSDASLVPVSDWSSDLTITPARASGGVGLGVSPVDTLLSNVAGYCDFLDARGAWVAGGAQAPPGAAWVRRWSVVPTEALADTLTLQVVVVPVSAATGQAAVSAARGVSGAWLTGMRTRRAQ